MMRIIRTQPLYLFLLPLFFVLHGFLENYGFISIRDAAILALSYIFLTIGLFIFSLFFFRDRNKGALITTTWMAFFFFFAAIHEFLRQHSPVHLFSRYSFLLSVFILFFVTVFIFLKKTANHYAAYGYS